MRLLIWLLFGVASAVLPLFLTGIIMFDHGRFLHWSDTWARGELILVSMTLLLRVARRLDRLRNAVPES